VNDVTPPLISYSTFYRLGLTVRNLSALLRTTDDFELHIIDSNSQDGTPDYLRSLTDSRIRSITALPVNRGPIYPINLNLTRRKPDQYFIVLESDVCLLAPDWITRLMRVFQTFPEVGLLGVPRQSALQVYEPEVIPVMKDGVGYLQLARSEVGTINNFIPGHCQCLRPELFGHIGYWCEENGYGDAELSVRVHNYTPYRAGLTTDIPIDMSQSISCDTCGGKPWCGADRQSETCFTLLHGKHKNLPFAEANRWKYLQYFSELEAGVRTAYCASIHDPASYASHFYHMDWALENFGFYEKNAN
jgi:hypothetical protein